MKQSHDKLFSAKILLFGEYSLLCGSMALSIPFDQFHGKLVNSTGTTVSDENKNSNKHIKDFLNFLLNLEKKKELAFAINTSQLLKDVDSGLFFESNIPRGYGLGSSGALVAAIFAEYGDQENFVNSLSNEQLFKLKSFFATLESYFHGKSSGLDPLISFLNRSLLLSGTDKLEILSSTRNSKKGAGAVFLIDSGAAGETQPLVEHFTKRYEDYSFKETIDKRLIPLVNATIESYTSFETDTLLNNLKKLSAFQIQEFDKMIPDSVQETWQKGLDSNKYYLKLCGSGGGGMILGFTSDLQNCLTHLSPFKPILIHYL